MDSGNELNKKENTQEIPHTVKGVQKRIIADSVLIRQGAVQSLEANSVAIRQGGVVISKAEQIELNSGGSVWSTGETVQLTNSSAVAMVSKGPSSLDMSGVQLLAAGGPVSMDQSAAGVLVSRDVAVENSAVVFLIAKNITGDVTPMFGPREAAVFGAVAGLVGAIVMIIARLFGKKRGQS